MKSKYSSIIELVPLPTRVSLQIRFIKNFNISKGIYIIFTFESKKLFIVKIEFFFGFQFAPIRFMLIFSVN